MTPLQKAKVIMRAGSQSMDFIVHCFNIGLCTIQEARRAMNAVHKQVMRDIDNAYLDEQFMKDRELEAREVL